VGNLTLNARVLALLADIMFAADEISDMVAMEHALLTFEASTNRRGASTQTHVA
jgi:hypothetical protein